MGNRLGSSAVLIFARISCLFSTERWWDASHLKLTNPPRAIIVFFFRNKRLGVESVLLLLGGIRPVFSVPKVGCSIGGLDLH